MTANILTGAFAVAARVIRRDANTAAVYAVCNFGALNRVQLQTRNATNDKFTGITTVAREFDTRLIVGRMYQLSMRRSAAGLVTGWVDGVQEPTTYSGDVASIGNGIISLGGAANGVNGLDGLCCDYAMWTPATGVPTDAELQAIGRNPLSIRDLLGMRIISTVPFIGVTADRRANGAVSLSEPDVKNWVAPGTNDLSTIAVNPPSWSVEPGFFGGASGGAKAAAGRRG